MATTGTSFNPAIDIPSLEGKVILITGANSGLGKEASLELAKHKPAQIWMAARSPEKGKEAVAAVQAQVPGAAVTFLEMDLSSFQSIKRAVKIVLANSPRLDILMLNAGRKYLCSGMTGPTLKNERCTRFRLADLRFSPHFAANLFMYSHGMPTKANGRWL